jgi:uncharacterized protein YndB with AHSA1/START domain
MKVEILLVEDYTHPIDKVWAAITDPAALAQWLMLNDFEPRIGKRFTLRAEPTAEWRGWMDCEVLEMEPPRRMLWSWHRSELDEPTRVEFRLEPSAGGTRLTLMHTGESDSMARGRYSSGWPIKLSNLGSLLAKTD